MRWFAVWCQWCRLVFGNVWGVVYVVCISAVSSQVVGCEVCGYVCCGVDLCGECATRWSATRIWDRIASKNRSPTCMPAS